MTEDRDPMLQAVFADTEQDLADATFTADVMARVEKSRHRLLARRIGAGLIVALCVLLVAGPIQDAVIVLAEGLTKPLIPVADRPLALLLSPVNNYTGLTALGFLIVRSLFRRVFS